MPGGAAHLALEIVLWVVAFAAPTVLWVVLGPHYLHKGLRSITGAVRFVLWRLSRPPVATLELSPATLRPDLAPPLREVGDETRLLLVALEPARQRAGAPGFDPGEDLRGELWTWLQTAEAALDHSGPHHDGLERATQEIRNALFSDRGLATQVDAIVRSLVGLDEQLRSQSGTPYRGPGAARVPSQCTEEDEETADREHLLAEHDDKLRAVARRYTHDEASREDVHQELRLAVWKALPKFRGDASVRTYISRVAHYCAARLRRKRPRHLPEKELVDEGPLPDQWLLARDRTEALHAAVAELPKRQRDAMRLHLEGLSTREIAEQLGITETNVGVRISRARKLLQATLLEEPEPA